MEKPESCIIPFLPVRGLLGDEEKELNLTLVAGEKGLENTIRTIAAQKPGLALAGFVDSVQASSIQILEKGEIAFLYAMSGFERRAILQQLCSKKIACFIIFGEAVLPEELLDEASNNNIPILKTSLKSPQFIEKLNLFLEEKLSPRITVHGVLLDIYGLGVLILGESGVGKSECALDLIVRGHRLVSDDTVEIRRKGEVLVGRGAEMTRYHMELRGLGIINIKDLFGVTAVRDEKNVEYLIQLDIWEEGKEYDRLGLEESVHEILGISLPFTEMPVAPGRNLSVLIEVAARNQLLKKRGNYSARRLAERLGERLKKGDEAGKVEE